MLYLLGKMACCLIAVAVVSSAFGWILRGKRSQKELRRVEKLWKINVLSKDLEKGKPHITEKGNDSP